MKFRTMLMAASFFAAPALLPLAAHAQPVTGPYVSAGLGYNIMGSRDWKSYTLYGYTTPATGSHFVFHNGYTGEASVGYGFGNGFRVELEGDYFNNAASKVDAYNNQIQAVISGNEIKYGAMANALYDFDIGVPYVYPYLGAGIGYQAVKWQNIQIPPATAGGTQGSFAYQGIVGFAFPIPSMPGLSGTLEYRYLATTGDQTFKGTFYGDGPTPVTFKMGNDTNNMVMLGLRYELFPPAPPPPAPAPAPVAAPAPAPARTYLVFFDWDKAVITPRATDIIADAANASHSTTVTQLKVNGYTDSSGPAGYNMKLSLRRANNVAALLVADGVPKNEIVIKGFGETHLLVPTGPNVREPQNRRVEIILH